MTGLTLTKHHGLGNDFLVLFADDADAPRPAGAGAAAGATGTRGIGADGLLVGSAGGRRSTPGWCSTTPTAAGPR